MDIEIRKPNRFKEFFQKLHSNLEDLLFNIISKIPERFIPSPLMGWLSRYLDKRISELEQETIRLTWRNTYLQNAADEIHARHQGTKEAPSDD